MASLSARHRFTKSQWAIRGRGGPQLTHAKPPSSSTPVFLSSVVRPCDLCRRLWLLNPSRFLLSSLSILSGLPHRPLVLARFVAPLYDICKDDPTCSNILVLEVTSMADHAHTTEPRHRSSTRHPRNPKYARKARPASLRFSRELEDLLQWEGLSRIENLDINDYGHTRSQGLGISDQDNVQIANMDEPADWQEFSELNTMLASAKRKLDVCHTLTTALSDLRQTIPRHSPRGSRTLFI